VYLTTNFLCHFPAEQHFAFKKYTFLLNVQKKVTHNNYQLKHLDTITPFFTMTHNQI